MKLNKKKKLLKALGNIEDFRKHDEQIVYSLSEVLFVALFGLVKGYNEFKELYIYFKFNKDNKLLKRLFKTDEIKVPSKSTFHRILSNVSYDGLETVFREFFSKQAAGKNIAIDGKWLNGSDIKGQYIESSHKSVLHIFDKNNKVVLGHKFMEKSKLSEIPALNEILKEKVFSNSGQIYTMDVP